MIKGLSDRRRLPRAGIIRLGIKKKHKESRKEYPVEVDYFVCPQLVQEQYGPEPKELIIMFPIESEQVFFQQFYKCYGNGILLCRGDGDEGTFWDFDKGDFRKRKCPCEKLENGKCKPTGILQFLLPEVKESVGVWQITTSSKNSIIDINSGIDFVRGLSGRVAMIPLLLKREPLETHRIEGKNIKKGKHFTMKLSLAMSLVEIQKLGQIPPAQALLPSPDESQEAIDDLFPRNGFRPEKEEVEKQPKEDVEPFKQELRFLLKKYKNLGKELSQKEQDHLDALENVESYKKAIKYYKGKIKKLEKKTKSDSEKPTSLFEGQETQ